MAIITSCSGQDAVVAYVFKTELDFLARSRTKKLPTPPAVLVCDDENHVLVDLLLKVVVEQCLFCEDNDRSENCFVSNFHSTHGLTFLSSLSSSLQEIFSNACRRYCHWTNADSLFGYKLVLKMMMGFMPYQASLRVFCFAPSLLNSTDRLSFLCTERKFSKIVRDQRFAL